MLISEIYTDKKVIFCERCDFSKLDVHNIERLGEMPSNPTYVCTKDGGYKLVDAFGYCYKAKPSSKLLKQCSDYKGE